MYTGRRVDAALRAAGASDMAYAVVLDAWLLWRWSRRPMPLNRRCAMRNGEEGQFLTGRFSPGYGDYPIAVQNDLLRLLDAPRKNRPVRHSGASADAAQRALRLFWAWPVIR